MGSIDTTDLERFSAIEFEDIYPDQLQQASLNKNDVDHNRSTNLECVLLVYKKSMI